MLYLIKRIKNRGGVFIKGKETKKQNKQHLQRIYWKMLIIYSMVLCSIVICLEVYFISSIRSEQIRRSKSDLRVAGMEAADYIQQLYSNAGNIQYAAYQVEDMENFLKLTTEEYLLKKFENYAASSSIKYYGVDYFVNNFLETDETLESISFLSNANRRLTSYMKDGRIKIREFEDWEFHTAQERLLRMDQLVVSTPFYSQDTRRSVIGNIVMNYSLDELNEIQEKYQNIEIAVFSSEKRLLFGTQNLKQIRAILNEEEDVTSFEYWERYLKSYVELNPVSECWIMAYIPKNVASHMPVILWVTFISIGISLFAMGELFLHLHLKRLTDRMHIILNAMGGAAEGKLDEKIPVPYNKPLDELDIIAKNFNQMCEDMNTYIQKSYLSEIEQKNAELCALQSQINPHFLYNTLEVIRMKAICNGDREVGRMLYSLAVIFRSQIKEKDIIPVAKELHYCKKYLELFEYRYHNKFSFEIQCPEELLEKPIIKFVVQPIIENYFVHGIRLEADDNQLIIKVFKEGKDIVIHVSDNGKGMAIEEIQKKNQQLKSGNQEKGSIGIQNVHIRMRVAYGENYGVSLKANHYGGVCVVLRFPGEEKKDV